MLVMSNGEINVAHYDASDFIDNSMINAFKKCPEHFRRLYMLRQVPAAPSNALTAGKAFAHGMEITRKLFYCEGETSESAIQKGREAVGIKMQGGNAEESTKTSERMQDALSHYFSKWPLEAYEPISIEGEPCIERSFSFFLPVTNPLNGHRFRYVCNPDLVAVHIDDPKQAVVIDEKTTSRLGEQWIGQWAMCSQVAGYLYGLSVLGISSRAEIHGISILKNTCGTATANIAYTPSVLDDWFKNTVLQVRAIAKMYLIGKEQPAMKVWGEACNSYGRPCDYMQLCQSPNPEILASDGRFVRNGWHPLKEYRE